MPGQEGILDPMEALEIRGRRRSSQPLYFLAATATILFEKGDQAAILTLVRPAWRMPTSQTWHLQQTDSGLLVENNQIPRKTVEFVDYIGIAAQTLFHDLH